MIADDPILTLKIGSSLNPKNIKEGDDVYFECYIRANPKIHKFEWFHNVSITPDPVNFYAVYTSKMLFTEEKFLQKMVQ